MRNTWQLQEAKNQFSLVVDNAMSRGAQIVKRHGEPAVVVISVAEYKNCSHGGKRLWRYCAHARSKTWTGSTTFRPRQGYELSGGRQRVVRGYAPVPRSTGSGGVRLFPAVKGRGCVEDQPQQPVSRITRCLSKPTLRCDAAAAGFRSTAALLDRQK